MAAMVEPAPQAPKPAGHAPLHELQLARTSLVRARTAARNRARHLTLPLLRRQHADRLRCIRRDLAAIDAAIAALIAADPEIARKAAILCSIPGISKVSAAAILADLPEIGTLEPAAVASLAGVAPITRESGEGKGQAKVGGGRRDLRRALYMPALAAARFNPNLEAVYERLQGKGKAGKARPHRRHAQAHPPRKPSRPREPPLGAPLTSRKLSRSQGRMKASGSPGAIARSGDSRR